MTYSTNTDFSRDLQYKIRVFINCVCVPGFSIDCCTLFKRRCMIIGCIDILDDKALVRGYLRSVLAAVVHWICVGVGN